MEKQLMEFIEKKFLKDKRRLSPKESLFKSGILDSFGMLELVAFVEKTFRVKILPREVRMENFDTVEKILKLIEKKREIKKA